MSTYKIVEAAVILDCKIRIQGRQSFCSPAEVVTQLNGANGERSSSSYCEEGHSADDELVASFPGGGRTQGRPHELRLFKTN